MIFAAAILAGLAIAPTAAPEAPLPDCRNIEAGARRDWQVWAAGKIEAAFSTRREADEWVRHQKRPLSAFAIIVQPLCVWRKG